MLAAGVPVIKTICLYSTGLNGTVLLFNHICGYGMTLNSLVDVNFKM